MKNLLVYINQNREFDKEGKIAIKIQIDNSLNLNWKKKDVMLVTNFPYEYKGVKAIVVKDNLYCEFSPTASKIKGLYNLFEKKIIKKGVIYWFHDIDAFQLHKISAKEIELKNNETLLPDFGRRPKWSTGSFFFKWGSEDIFKLVIETIEKYKIDEEGAFCIITGQNYYANDRNPRWIRGYTSKELPQIETIKKRIKKANISYNFHSFNIRSNYAAAVKPIRVAHFHFLPKPINPMNARPDQLDFFLRGKNKIGVQLIPDRLIKIFNQYGIK